MCSNENEINLPNETITKCLNDLICEHFPKQNYTYKVEIATQKGDNYIGIVYRITIMFQQSDKEPFSLILKVPPQNLVRRKQFFARPAFLREAKAYDEFLPMVIQFQDSKCIPTDKNFNAIVRCYRTITTEMDEAIFLEDLQPKGYRMFNRFDSINVDNVRFVMRIYGRLHALSFAIKDQSEEKLLQFQQLQDIFEQRKHDPQLGAYFEELKKSALSTLNTQKDAKYIEKLQRFFAKGTFFDMLLEYIDGKKCEPYAVVCHGDCWNNNILFKYVDEFVIDACLIDWQVMRYASPITDIMYYLFTCTTKDFRGNFYDEMLSAYYKELSDHIERLGSSSVKLFSKDIFYSEVQKFGAIGLLLAMIVLPIITMESDEVPDLEELSARIEAGATTDLKDSGLLGQSNINAYSKRMRDTIIDCIDLEYI